MMERYDRQRLLQGFDQDLLLGAHILVVGAGTTGNEVIKNLALLGVGRLTICDIDTIETVNLSRSVLFRDHDIGASKAEVAARRASELNPEMLSCTAWNRNIVYETGNLEYRNFDCVILTVDNLEARLWVNRYCWFAQTPLIDTGVHGLAGNVNVVMSPSPPCLECGWSLRAYQRLAERLSCLKVGLDLDEPKIPMVISTAAVIAGMAVQECVGILHDKKFERVDRAGKSLSFDGEVNALLRWQTPERDDCPGHGTTWADREVCDIGVTTTDDVGDVIPRLKLQLGADAVELSHDKELVYATVCNTCGQTDFVQPIQLGMYRRRVCPSCGSFAVVPKETSAELRPGTTIGAIGVPANHALLVTYARGDHVSEGWCAVR